MESGIPRHSENPLLHGSVSKKSLCRPGVRGTGVGLSIWEEEDTRSAIPIYLRGDGSSYTQPHGGGQHGSDAACHPR